MGLLFMLSGIATAFMAARHHPDTLWLKRSRRLIVPVIVGLVFLTPVHIYFVLKAKLGYDESFLDFLAHNFSADRTVSVRGERFGLPFLMDLWYLVYLALYTLVLLALLKWAPGHVQRVERFIASRITPSRVILWPMLFLVVLRIGLYPIAPPPPSENLGGDIYRHVVFFGLFLFGFLVGRYGQVWSAFARGRWLALAMAAAAFTVFGYLTVVAGRGMTTLAEQQHPVLLVIQPVQMWAAIYAAFGFATVHVSKDGPALRYLSNGAVTVYVVHHPAMILMAYFCRGLRLPPSLEAPVIAVGVVAISLASYELLRRASALAGRLRTPAVALGPADA
jgi:surface polysaccharide O-acyltransferase-like enzyme